ncbi:glutamate 5-kinase [Streptococcus pneumoniae]|nr:glutamate 5-kinase [Streptococcus pneumoniae]
MKYKRIVFKVGTSSLTNEDGSLSRSKVKDITQQLAMLHEAGHELILVSSGAIAAGFGQKTPANLLRSWFPGSPWTAS